MSSSPTDAEDVVQDAVLRAFRGFDAFRGEEAKAIQKEAGVRARPWVVERAHSWMNRFRGVLIRWAKRVDTYLAMLHFACALITWKKVLLNRT